MEEKNYETRVGLPGEVKFCKTNNTMKDIVSELSARTAALLTETRKYSTLLFGRNALDNNEEQKFSCMQEELEFVLRNVAQTQEEFDCMFNLLGVGR